MNKNTTSISPVRKTASLGGLILLMMLLVSCSIADTRASSNAPSKDETDLTQVIPAPDHPGKDITAPSSDDKDSPPSPKAKDKPPIKELEMIEVCERGTKTTVQILPGEFKPLEHSTDWNDCEEIPGLLPSAPPPKGMTLEYQTIEVCERGSQDTVQIWPHEFNSAIHSKDWSDCGTADSSSAAPNEKELTYKMVKVCERGTKAELQIWPHEFNRLEHSKDWNDCEEIPGL